ncbi:glutamate 5-kinase-like protein [Emericellopsis cladophorae]|uniref:Glutamate 5-kinase-like protein n=1 Tax=Emericellopsis cladophorae TaxID=2686198 RepID=A0A9P9Y9T2_9HYPO|nr:glutamate 5-kinase-like protein [Emericellopsis cladophorae]KAI6785783.1 glutamate 5-kinase-like protein [Emericellopsis cladophorae]
MTKRSPHAMTVVIKLGTSSIVDEKTHEPLLPILTLIVDTAVKLRKSGHRVVLVSSGAIGVGLRRMDVDHRPKHLSQLQALAAIGQCRLMSLWDGLFQHLEQPIAQILLTKNDIADRTRYLNAQNTFNSLLDMGVIPIVNENDTLAVSEIKFGDNDTLSAITAAMIHADHLFLMTDVDCLYDKNPRSNPDAKPIEVVEDIADVVADVSSAGSSVGTGGMGTKLIAARLGTSAGVTVIITRSSNPGNILNIVNYLTIQSRAGTPDDEVDELSLIASSTSLNLMAPSGASDGPPLHTRFLPSSEPIRDRHFWLLHTLNPHGTIYIDQGAYRALVNKAGLLPVGVVDVEGNFASHEPVRIVVVNRLPTPGPDGKMRGELEEEVGRAIVNYASAEITRIMGHQSHDIEECLGYADSEYVANRQHVVFFRKDSRPPTPVQTPAQTPAITPGQTPLQTPGA